MRIKPNVNRLIIKVKNATTMTKFKLPRKKKKAFIKLYGRKSYNSIMIRLQLKNNKAIQLKKSMNAFTKSLKPLAVNLKAAADAIKKIGLYPEMMSEKIQNNLTIGKCVFQENNYGVLLNFEDEN